MKTICAWCNKLLKPGDGPTTHGICPECFVTQTDEIVRFSSKDLPTSSPVNEKLSSQNVNRENSGAGPSIKPAFAILVVIGCMLLAASSEVLLDQVPQWIVASVAWVGAGCLLAAFVTCIVGIIWQSIQSRS